MTRVNFSTRKFLATLLVASIPILGGGMTPANASTIPAANTQGGSEGVLYFTEPGIGTIHIGDIGATPSTASVFWEDAASKVDQVAVTQKRIAWASQNATSNMRNQVKISNVGLVAGTITTVNIDLPSGRITSLTADPFGERFFITTSVGDIWLIPSNGVSSRRVFDGRTGADWGTDKLKAKEAIEKVWWGAWFDPYNSKYYFCTLTATPSFDSSRIYVASVTGTTMALPTVVRSSGSEVRVQTCDGLGVNPSTQEMFALSTQSRPGMWFRVTAQGVSTRVNPRVGDSTSTGAVNSGVPSSMFVSHTTGKLYFTTESAVFESNFNGTNTRTLYTGADLQNLAVYYGASLSTIDNFVNPTVVFDANGGTGARTFQHGSSATALTMNPYTRSDYTFAGWNTLSNGTGTAYVDGETYPFTAYTTLFAQWTLNPPPPPPAEVTPPAAVTTPATVTTPAAVTSLVSTTSPTPAAVNTPASTSLRELAATGLGMAERTLVFSAASVLLVLGASLLWIRRRLSL